MAQRRSFGRGYYLSGLIVLGTLLIGVLACGGAEATATATRAPAAATATTAPAAPTATTAPAAPTATTAPAAPTATAAPAATATRVATATALPTPAPIPTRAAPSGTVTGVIGGLGVGTPSGYPTDCLWCASIVMVGAHEALWAVERDSGGNPAAAGWLAESWTTSPDLKYTDIKLRKGVKFHQNFGEMTAKDVVYTYQAGMPTYTKGAVHDTLPIPALTGVDLVDDYTVRFTWSAYNALTIFEGFTDYGEGIGIFSKKAADEKGVEWLRQNVIGTGPYAMTEWTAQKIIDLKAVPEHWKNVANVDRIKLLEIPENSIRKAMLESGQADMGEVPIQDWAGLLSKGFKKSNEQIINGIEIIMGGQYWSKNKFDTGEALDRTGNTRKVDTTKPWIGDPFATGCDQDDLLLNAKPKGTVCPSMEVPRKFRWALAQDIDRDGITKSIVGQGGPLYIRTHPDDPIWKGNAGASRWPVKYDPAEAKKLMKEAYPNGLTAPITWWVGPSGLEVEVSEAIAAQWLSDLNVKVEFDRRVYSAQRPNMVDRTSTWLQTRNCCNPGTRLLSEEWIFSSAVPAGYNHAQELPFASKIYYQKIKENDLKKVESMTAEMIDHHWYWMIDIGITAPPNTTLYNGNRIAEWKQRPYNQFRLGGMRNALDTLKLK
jgi:ABC-type transport system substrate-binding protein